ncbi:gephyrin-like molybdotransferase Glp [Alteromonas flava]|uniref:molybdopterin molybdotransferase MoeA n=1 Tax=Alteromonas flava TaxID=2048003 RepID=UPI000C284F72|nr:gephyrin-like molybdotransferase Glp [Alteromonas flava]
MQHCDTANGLMPFNEAKKALLATITTCTKTEEIELTLALGRIVAIPVKSKINVPSTDNAAMDGYAICDPSLTLTTFTLVGRIQAGECSPRELQPGECIRIMTGAPVPIGTTAVEMQENAKLEENSVYIQYPPKSLSNIRKEGEDIQCGQTILNAGERLKTVDIGLLASLGIAIVTVYKKPSIAILSTGDELVQPGDVLSPGQIYDSNRYTLIAMLQRLPVDVLDLGHVNDNPLSLEAAFLQASEKADVILTSGGVSVGDADYTTSVLDEIGSIHFAKIAMKPGKPFAFGQIAARHFFGLPGNPVSAAVTFHQLVVPALKKLCGDTTTEALPFKARLTKSIRKRPGRLDFQRAQTSLGAHGQLLVTPLSHQGSGVLSSLSKANCYILVPSDSTGYTADEEVTIQLFDDILR